MFDSIWNDEDKLTDVTEDVIEMISAVYQENAPELVYFILLLSIALKKQEFDGRVVEAIARQNPHNLVFLLTYENSRQIALCTEQAESVDELSIEERLALQEKIQKLEKLIQKTEAAAWKAQQPKKQFELYTHLQQYKQELEELKHGQA